MKTEYNLAETDNEGIYNLTKTTDNTTILLTGVTLEEIYHAVNKQREKKEWVENQIKERETP